MKTIKINTTKTFKIISLSLFILIASLLITSCESQEPKKDIVTIDNLYTIELPDILSKATNLNDDATLQYQNLLQELYIIEIHESIDEFEKVMKDSELDKTYSVDLDGYTKLLLDNFYTSVKPIKDSGIQSSTINSMDAKIIEMEAKSGDLEIYYHIAFVKGKKNYYQLMTWTLLNKKEDHKQAMKAMIESFKEI